MKSWKVKTKEQFSVPGGPVLDFHFKMKWQRTVTKTEVVCVVKHHHITGKRIKSWLDSVQVEFA